VNLNFDYNTKYDFFVHIKPGNVFLASPELLKYMRTSVKNQTYYKFSIKNLLTLDEDLLPILMYMDKHKHRNRYLEYKFLYQKEILYLYDDDFETLSNFFIKIIC